MQSVDVAVAARPALIRDVISRALAARLNLTVVPIAWTGDEAATRSLRDLQPRILLIDDDGSPSGREADIRRLHEASPSTRILVLTIRSEEDRSGRFVRAGAHAIVRNRSDLPGLVRAVEAVLAGKRWEPAASARGTLATPDRFPDTVSAPEVNRRLTKREWEVADLVAKGLRNKVIALHLNISVDTVKTHINNCFRKLAVESRLALGILAQDRLRSRDT